MDLEKFSHVAVIYILGAFSGLLSGFVVASELYLRHIIK